MVHNAYLADKDGRLIMNGKPSRIVLVKKPPLAAVVMVPRHGYVVGNLLVNRGLLCDLSKQFVVDPESMLSYIERVVLLRQHRSMGVFAQDIARTKAKAANRSVLAFKNDVDVSFVIVKGKIK